MDSTPIFPQPQPQPQPLNPSASKLPIKRKTPNPQQEQQRLLTPKFEFEPVILCHPDDGSASASASASVSVSVSVSAPKPKPPPFKFHRIWTEPDELAFLQGLLQSHTLSFPKDLPIFYSNFCNSMSQPYTKSQLSEKLRRLRKKFRVVSSRLARGLNFSSLSAHDQALFDLSKRLWSPEFASTSSFGKNSNLGFSQFHENNNGIVDGSEFDDACGLIDNDGEMKINESNVGYDFGGGGRINEMVVNNGVSIEEVVVKSVLNVFDECFKEVQMVMSKQGVAWMDAMERRWKEQRISELDVFGRRLRLVIENSLTKQ